jgi:hypothetical protein
MGKIFLSKRIRKTKQKGKKANKKMASARRGPLKARPGQTNMRKRWTTKTTAWRCDVGKKSSLISASLSFFFLCSARSSSYLFSSANTALLVAPPRSWEIM